MAALTCGSCQPPAGRGRRTGGQDQDQDQSDAVDRLAAAVARLQEQKRALLGVHADLEAFVEAEEDVVLALRAPQRAPKHAPLPMREGFVPTSELGAVSLEAAALGGHRVFVRNEVGFLKLSSQPCATSSLVSIAALQYCAGHDQATPFQLVAPVTGASISPNSYKLKALLSPAALFLKADDNACAGSVLLVATADEGTVFNIVNNAQIKVRESGVAPSQYTGAAPSGRQLLPDGGATLRLITRGNIFNRQKYFTFLTDVATAKDPRGDVNRVRIRGHRVVCVKQDRALVQWDVPSGSTAAFVRVWPLKLNNSNQVPERTNSTSVTKAAHCREVTVRNLESGSRYVFLVQPFSDGEREQGVALQYPEDAARAIVARTRSGRNNYCEEPRVFDEVTCCETNTSCVSGGPITLPTVSRVTPASTGCSWTVLFDRAAPDRISAVLRRAGAVTNLTATSVEAGRNSATLTLPQGTTLTDADRVAGGLQVGVVASSGLTAALVQSVPVPTPLPGACGVSGGQPAALSISSATFSRTASGAATLAVVFSAAPPAGTTYRTTQRGTARLDESNLLPSIESDLNPSTGTDVRTLNFTLNGLYGVGTYVFEVTIGGSSPVRKVAQEFQVPARDTGAGPTLSFTLTAHPNLGFAWRRATVTAFGLAVGQRWAAFIGYRNENSDQGDNLYESELGTTNPREIDLEITDLIQADIVQAVAIGANSARIAESGTLSITVLGPMIRATSSSSQCGMTVNAMNITQPVRFRILPPGSTGAPVHTSGVFAVPGTAGRMKTYSLALSPGTFRSSAPYRVQALHESAETVLAETNDVVLHCTSEENSSPTVSSVTAVTNVCGWDVTLSGPAPANLSAVLRRTPEASAGNAVTNLAVASVLPGQNRVQLSLTQGTLTAADRGRLQVGLVGTNLTAPLTQSMTATVPDVCIASAAPTITSVTPVLNSCSWQVALNPTAPSNSYSVVLGKVTPTNMVPVLTVPVPANMPSVTLQLTGGDLTAADQLRVGLVNSSGGQVVWRQDIMSVPTTCLALTISGATFTRGGSSGADTLSVTFNRSPPNGMAYKTTRMVGSLVTDVQTQMTATTVSGNSLTFGMRAGSGSGSGSYEAGTYVFVATVQGATPATTVTREFTVPSNTPGGGGGGQQVTVVMSLGSCHNSMSFLNAGAGYDPQHHSNSSWVVNVTAVGMYTPAAFPNFQVINQRPTTSDYMITFQVQDTTVSECCTQEKIEECRLVMPVKSGQGNNNAPIPATAFVDMYRTVNFRPSRFYIRTPLTALPSGFKARLKSRGGSRYLSASNEQFNGGTRVIKIVITEGIQACDEITLMGTRDLLSGIVTTSSTAPMIVYSFMTPNMDRIPSHSWCPVKALTLSTQPPTDTSHFQQTPLQ